MPEGRAPTNIEEARNPELAEWDDCWRDCRIAMKGTKAVRANAVKHGWIELPEHIVWQKEFGTSKQKELAAKAEKAYIQRLQYDDAARRARAIIIGSVMRKDVQVQGVTDGNERGIGSITRGDLDRGDSRGRNLHDYSEYLLSEKATTRYTATYIYMKKVDGKDVGKWKTYHAENIWDIDDDCGSLSYIVFREQAPVEGKNKFDRHKTETVFRELSLEYIGDDQSRRRVVERIWRKDPDDSKKYYVRPEEDILISVRETNLTEIPVVIDGGLMPDNPMLEGLCEKSKELLQATALIKYRTFKMGHPTLHINYEEEPGKAFISSGENRHQPHQQHRTNADDLKDAPKQKKAIVPGMALVTQKTSVKYLYDTGEGMNTLLKEREDCKNDLEALGATYGVTNNSNIAENTERMQQGKETAFIIAHVGSTSRALTEIARWLAFFNGVTSDERLGEIKVELNLCLTDEGPSFSFDDIRNLLMDGAIDGIIAVRMLRILLPDTVIEPDLDDEEILARIERARSASLFNVGDVDDEADEETQEAA